MDAQNIIVDIIISNSYWIYAVSNNRKDALDVNKVRPITRKDSVYYFNPWGLTNQSNDFLQLCVLDSAVQADMRNNESAK